MIYTKGKAGHYMGNTDISVNTLPDANTENTTEHSTIFDDVFRTIAQKMVLCQDLVQVKMRNFSPF